MKSFVMNYFGYLVLVLSVFLLLDIVESTDIYWIIKFKYAQTYFTILGSLKTKLRM